jgi:hypothetical protein
MTLSATLVGIGKGTNPALDLELAVCCIVILAHAKRAKKYA